ncbi:MAG: BON domain-containing protein [Bacillota bacterium]
MGKNGLQASVEKLLKTDKNLRGYGIKARTQERTVYVTGVVDTLREKEYLNELLRSIPGVKEVVNDVSISTDGAIDDGAVFTEVSEELAAEPGVDPQHIGARVKNGIVTLVGTTQNPEEIESARLAAEKARGVKAVKSKVNLRAGKRSLEGIFHSQVRNDRED